MRVKKWTRWETYGDDDCEKVTSLRTPPCVLLRDKPHHVSTVCTEKEAQGSHSAPLLLCRKIVDIIWAGSAQQLRCTNLTDRMTLACVRPCAQFRPMDALSYVTIRRYFVIRHDLKVCARDATRYGVHKSPPPRPRRSISVSTTT